MRRFHNSIVVLCGLLLSLIPATAEAGPLLNWIKERCGGGDQTTPVGGMTATSGSFTSAPTTLMPGQCQQTCMQTCQKVTVNYVPYTDYRTTWQRVPVTNYRPVTSTDPTSGCTTTCMRPCTDYQWQLQRIPYTTYRPVYQTQNYQVPVTTITNDCGANAGCSTCAVPGAMPPTGFSSGQPAGFYPGVSGGPTMPSQVPADGVPMLGSQMPTPVDPYAASRAGAFRPNFPAGNVALGNPYANPNAYSGMSTASGYQAPPRRSPPPVYYPPQPSGFAAPNPEPAPALAPPPATSRSIMDDFSNQSRPSSGTATLAPPAWPDPVPAQRWEYNTPPSGSSGDQTAHRDVQQPWDYSPVRLASFEVPVTEAIAAPLPVAPVAPANEGWNHDRGLNADWN